jgi:hypothetical protein
LDRSTAEIRLSAKRLFDKTFDPVVLPGLIEIDAVNLL